MSPAKVIVTIFALTFLLCTACQQSVIHSGPDLQLFDDFEGNSVADFWLPGDYGSGRYKTGAVTISKSYARSGISSARITVKEGDIEQINDDGVHLERAELDSGLHPFLHRDIWVGFSFLLPPDFPVVNNRLVIAQWKQKGFSQGPLVAQRFRDGNHYLTVRDPNQSDGVIKFPLPQIAFGRWNDMIWHVRFSPEKDGCVEVWMNGVQVVSHTGSNSVKNGENSFYHKIGLYRDRWKEPMTIYFDNYTLSDSLKAVDPARFD